MKEYIIAIDLGTSCTAYSWKSAVDPTPVVGTPDIKPGKEVSGKSPTALLLQGSLSAKKVFTASGVEAYGSVAQDRYATNDFPHGAQLFKGFKMRIHKDPETTNFDDLLNAATRSTSRVAEMSLEELFVLALKHIKEKALQAVTVTRKLKAEDVWWVLTVPVCCSNPAKYFMRHCAFKAGFIVGGADDESLVICMEPIAACLALGDRLDWKVYDKYLVIDCGGGTVDISTFEVYEAEQGKLSQVGEATGGPWGATKVDIQFANFLEDFVRIVASDAGDKCLEAFFASSGRYRITQAWESAKINLKNVHDDIFFDLSELNKEPLEVTMADMDNGRRLKNQNRSGEELLGGFGTWDLILKPALLQKFFRRSTNKIAECVAGQLDMPHTQGLTSIVMVGGFSGSAHLQKAVKDCVRTKYSNGEVKVIIPASPDLAVVQGAAHFVAFPEDPAPSLRTATSSRRLMRSESLSGARLPHPGAPMFERITSAFSYGIITSESGDILFSPAFFDSLIVKGEGYAPNHKVNQSYRVQKARKFKICIGSSSNSSIIAGSNRLDDIGGKAALKTCAELTVQPQETSDATSQVTPDATPPQSSSWFSSMRCCRNKRSVVDNTSNPDTSTDEGDDLSLIWVQFSLRGIELHVLVTLGGQELMRQVLSFLGE